MKILYHANCTDGAGAALAIWLKHGDEGHEYIPVQYSEEPPFGLNDKDVVMVDFSYKRDVIKNISKIAKSILIIDHHKSARDELKNIEDICLCPVQTVFDMEKSGAVLAWEFFHPDRTLPKLFRCIQDRDLWLFEHPDTNDIIKGLQLIDDWKVWERFLDKHSTDAIRLNGYAINKFLKIQSDKIINKPPIYWEITKDTVPVYNLPGFMISDTLSQALDKYPDAPYAVAYFDLPDKRVYSLRSRKGTDVDVSEIAICFGGGGHKHAAGFTTSLPKV